MTSFTSPFANTAIQRAAVLSYAVVDEVHTLVDEPYIPRRLAPRIRRLGVAGLIFFGTLISTLGKLAYELEVTGRDGSQRPFQKPWFLVLLMFIGMALNLPLSLFLDLVRRSKRRLSKVISRRRPLSVEPLYSPLLQYDPADDEEMYVPVIQSPRSASSSQPQRFRLLDKQLLVLLVPTLFDLLGAALLNIGLLAVTASATAMLRQSLLLFAALLGVGLFRKRLNLYHATGLGGCTVGLSLVSAASLASGFGGSTASGNRGSMAIGILLILASQAVAACQLLTDQSWYISRLQLSPLKVVGAEGLLGAAITVLLLLLFHASSVGPEGRGLSEDSLDSLLMIMRSPLLLVLLAVYTGSLQAYNICGMALSGELSAVDTTLLQAVRTLFVWIVNLLVYAVATALTPDAADQSQVIGGLYINNTTVTAAINGGWSTGQQQGLQQQRLAFLSGSHSRLSDRVAGAAAGLQVADPAAVSAALAALPGEPWLRWSFLQAAGFLVLVAAAVTYSKGDNEGLRRQLEDEAALIMLDQPPSVAGSQTASNRLFTAHMDIDTAAYLRSFARRRDHEVLYGITPVPSVQSGHREGFRSSREGPEGLEPLLSLGASGVGDDQGFDDGIPSDSRSRSGYTPPRTQRSGFLERHSPRSAANSRNVVGGSPVSSAGASNDHTLAKNLLSAFSRTGDHGIAGAEEQELQQVIVGAGEPPTHAAAAAANTQGPQLVVAGGFTGAATDAPISSHHVSPGGETQTAGAVELAPAAATVSAAADDGQ